MQLWLKSQTETLENIDPSISNVVPQSPFKFSNKC